MSTERSRRKKAAPRRGPAKRPGAPPAGLPAEPPGPLSGKQRRFLRGKGHGLAATVQVGKEGLSEALVKALAAALDEHELVKVKLGPAAGLDRYAAAEELATSSESQLVQVLGNTILLYRRNAEEPQIELPA